MADLLELFRQEGANKMRPEVRHFAECYEQHFEPEKVYHLLEIGIQGGGSLRAWGRWLEGNHDGIIFSPIIVGVDIQEDCKELELPENIKVRVGDQADPEFLASLVSEFSYFDVVTDDGSHHGCDQWASFKALWPVTRQWYVIEDLYTSFWPAFFSGDWSTGLGLVQTLCECVQVHGAEHDRAMEFRHSVMFPDVAEVHLYPGIVFVKKGGMGE